MFRAYQVRFSSNDKRYRCQLVCGGSSHHHHLFTTTPCSLQQQTSCRNLTGMPPFLAPSNHQSYVDIAQQLNSVALRKIISQITPEKKLLNEMNDNSISNETTIEDENSSLTRTIQDTSTISRTITTDTTNNIQSSNGYFNDTAEEESMKSLDKKDLGLTWIDWDWPGNHIPCPYNPSNSQLSTRVHHLPVRYKLYLNI